MCKEIGLFRTNALLFFAFAIVFFSACKKKETPPPAATVTIEKNSYTPYEVVFLKYGEAIKSNTFNATIGDKSVEVVATDSSAAFVLPKLADGTYQLSFSLNDNEYSIPINVTAGIMGETPNFYFYTIMFAVNSQVSQIYRQIESYVKVTKDYTIANTITKDVDRLNIMFKESYDAYNALTDVEKTEFAKGMTITNKMQREGDSLQTFLFEAANQIWAIPSASADHETNITRLARYFEYCVNYNKSHVLRILAMAKGSTTVSPWVGDGAKQSSNFMVQLLMLRLLNTMAVGATTIAYPLQPTNLEAPTGTLLYQNGIERYTNITSLYRTPFAADNSAENENKSTGKIAGRYADLYKLYNTLKEKLPAKFSTTYSPSPLPDTYTTIRKAVNAKYIQLSDNTNSLVVLQQANKIDGKLRTIATTSTSTAQTFSCKFTYVNTDFSQSDLLATMNGQVSPSAPAFNLAALWSFTLYNVSDGSFYQTYQFTTDEFGQAKWPCSLVTSTTPKTDYEPATNWSIEYWGTKLLLRTHEPATNYSFTVNSPSDFSFEGEIIEGKWRTVITRQ